jgi:hypothetical protein
MNNPGHPTRPQAFEVPPVDHAQYGTVLRSFEPGVYGGGYKVGDAEVIGAPIAEVIETENRFDPASREALQSRDIPAIARVATSREVAVGFASVVEYGGEQIGPSINRDEYLASRRHAAAQALAQERDRRFVEEGTLNVLTKKKRKDLKLAA